MAGYWKNPASTADTVKEGWLYTGDMGYMRDGLLYVLGRFKSLLIGSDGEKYSPEGIEEALVEHSSCIDQLILYNNQSPYTTALLVPNKERLRKHLAHQNLDLSSDQGREEAIRIIQRQIDRFRKGGDLSTLFPDRWLPTTFAIPPRAFYRAKRHGKQHHEDRPGQGRESLRRPYRPALYSRGEESAEQVEQGGVVETRRAASHPLAMGLATPARPLLFQEGRDK